MMFLKIGLPPLTLSIPIPKTEPTSDKIICQESEVAEASFVSYQDALKILTFEETKNILKDAEIFICSN